MRKLLSSGPSRAAKPAEYAAYGVLAGVCLIFVFVVGLTLLMPRQSLFSTHPLRSESDAEMRTGTIRLAPTHDDLCRELEFDNPSGRFRDRGLTPCGESAAQNESNQPATPFDKIREGFNNR